VSVPRIHELSQIYQPLGVDFLAVYVSEAHASDEWKLGSIVEIPQHRTVNDRLAAATKFQKETGYKIPLVVDTLDNEFEKTYAAWPERAYIVEGGRVVYVCDMKEDGNMDWENGVANWLSQRFETKKEEEEKKK